MGAKHAFLFASTETGFNSLQICNISLLTGEFDLGPYVIVPEGPRNPMDVTSACDGSTTLLAWIEESEGAYELRCGRVTPDLNQLDPGGIVIADGAVPSSIKLAYNTSGGMLGWFDLDGDVRVQRFDADGLPAGGIISIAREGAPLHAQVAVSPLGDDWLVSWSNNGKTPSYCLVDNSGEMLPPGVVHLRGDSAYWGLASTSSDGMGFITWRSGSWSGVQACRIAPGGELLDTLPLLVSDFDAYEYNYESEFRRGIACGWTGEHFVVYWNTWWVANPYEQDDPSTLDGHCQRWGVDTGWRPRHSDHFSRFKNLPILAQWVSPDGENLYSEPVKTNYGTWTTDVASVFTGDTAINAMVDEGSDHYIHFTKSDVFGTPIGYGSREYMTNELATKIYGLEARPCDEGAVFAWQWTGQRVHEWWTRLTIAQVNADCEVVHSGSVQISQNVTDVVCENWDVALADENMVLVYDRREFGSPTYCIAALIDRRRTLYVDPAGSEAMEPTICKGDDNYIMAWAEDHGSARRIYFTAFGPYDDIPDLEGAPLTGPLGSQRQPYLIRGPENVLCAFVMAVPETETSTDIYGVRIAFDGTLLDNEPILIASMPELTWHVRGTWSGNNYFVTWTTPDAGPSMHGARLTAAGVPLDPAGFYICECDDEPGRPGGNNTWGHVNMTYGGNQLRLIVDVPGKQEETPADGPIPVIRSNQFRLLSPSPNPAAGAITLAWQNPAETPVALEIVNVNGRTVRTISRSSAHVFGQMNWDGRLSGGEMAPGGVYFIRAQGKSGGVSKRFVLVR
jgi:hypothetical protein